MIKKNIELFKAKTFEDVISKEEINKLLSFVKLQEKWQDGGGLFWENRVLNLKFLFENKNVDIAIIVNNIRKKIKKIIELEYGNGKEVYADLIQIVRWFPGMEQQPHADDMKNIDDADKWFNHRDFGAILYLNDDYEGGITYYPEYELGIIPKSGRLAIHPGDSDHLHGVTKIENVNRYTIASFWTFDKSYESDYSFIPE
jgi:hypothetical protein